MFILLIHSDFVVVVVIIIVEFICSASCDIDENTLGHSKLIRTVETITTVDVHSHRYIYEYI